AEPNFALDLDPLRPATAAVWNRIAEREAEAEEALAWCQTHEHLVELAFLARSARLPSLARLADSRLARLNAGLPAIPEQEGRERDLDRMIGEEPDDDADAIDFDDLPDLDDEDDE
ncbi:MAG: hypothetical protein MH204_00970, partial [Fimbriimonadaceae bacterium]|nr:hypothetical protein [Fimbriimonadaceae bacterium]